MTSSNIEAVGYDEESRQARVKFRSGATYSYDDVSREEFDMLRAAESPSRHLNAFWKGVYVAKRLSE